MAGSKITRREFMGATAAIAGTVSIVPSHVLGGGGKAAPSDTVTYAVIGNGSRRDAGIKCLGARKKIAVCDVDTGPRHLGGQGDNKTRYTDYRLLLERKDLDVVCIGTPPHWHALPCIHAAQAGKDIFCEKPMTKFIAEGRAVADAVERYGVVFQIGTFNRYKNAKKKEHIENHKIVKYGLMKDLSGTVAFTGAKNRTGRTDLPPNRYPIAWTTTCGWARRRTNRITRNAFTTPTASTGITRAVTLRTSAPTVSTRSSGRSPRITPAPCGPCPTRPGLSIQMRYVLSDGWSLRMPTA